MFSIKYIFLTVIVFWNLENFFDTRDDSLSVSDHEFSARGERRWTKKRFEAKVRAIGKSILYIGSEEGRLPDVIGVAEVENAYVLKMVVKGSLRKAGYKVVHYDSPDPRGIDVGLLYREATFALERSSPVRIRGFPTRDLLLADLRRKSDGELFHFIVCHLPSKYGGEQESLPKRRKAVSRLMETIDSVSSVSAAPIVIMGDFNDTPSSEALKPLGGPMVNMALKPAGPPPGTIRFEGVWELIDMFFVSPPISDVSEMKIRRLPFLMTRDKAHGGEKPLRTYVGPRYTGGVSDHCPVSLTVYCRSPQKEGE